MRSLHVITSDARRGAETFAIDLAEALNARGGIADVAALTSSGLPGRHLVSALGPSTMHPRTLAALRQRTRRTDVVVAHGSSTLTACAVALSGTHVPFVYRNIGDPTYWASSARRRWQVRAMLRRATRVVALWPEAADQLTAVYAIGPQRIDVVPNAVLADRFELKDSDATDAARRALSVGRDQHCVVYVGALSREKNVAAAIRALACVPDTVLLIAGEGPQRAHLEALVEAVIPGRARFLGALRDVRPVLTAADALVLPSRSEGMPAAVIEAGLVGTPSVATRVGGLPTIIEHGQTGFLVPPDSPTALARWIREAVAAPHTVGVKAARAFRERYTLAQVAPLWEQVLRRAVEPVTSRQSGLRRS